MSEASDPANPKPPSVDRVSRLWRRVSEHKIVEWSVGYVALAFGIQHAVVLTGEAFEWPHAVLRVSMLLLVLGLPLVMTFGWYQGQRANRQFSGAELTIVAILLVIASLMFYAFVQPSEDVASAPATAKAPPVAVSAARAPATPAAPATSAAPAGVSIAVLPFLNLSGDPSQEFFSDGMTEEITSALVKIPGMSVVARTSAFEFKGEKRNIQAIGQALHATDLIEGSVRKDGNQVRITAQLIKADDGTHLWTESYDRELKGVFAVQEDIAEAIAGAMQVPLGLKKGETLVSNRTADTESYQDYLRAKAMFRMGSSGNAQSVALLEKIVARDPGFAPAWGLLAQAYVLTPTVSGALQGRNIADARQFIQSYSEKAEKAAREAIRLDSGSAVGRAALARVQARQGKWAAAEDLYKQALAFDPADPDTLRNFADQLDVAGRLKEGLSANEKLRMLEPLDPDNNRQAAAEMLAIGQNAAAIAIMKSLPASSFLAAAYAAQGRYGEAADTVLLLPEKLYGRQTIEDAAHLLRTAPTKVQAPEALPLLDSALAFVYAYVGASDRYLDLLERAAEIRGPVNVWYWSAAFAPMRKTERFKAFVRKRGLLDYWRARGWPDLCHPVGQDDFACD